MAEFILCSIVIIWLFVILPIIVALYTFAPTFLAVSLGVFMLIGAIGAIYNAYKRQKLAKL